MSAELQPLQIAASDGAALRALWAPAPAARPAPAWTHEQVRAALASLPDRRATADLETCVEWLGNQAPVDRDRICALGLGMGGTLAFLLGCASRGLAGVVDY